MRAFIPVASFLLVACAPSPRASDAPTAPRDPTIAPAVTAPVGAPATGPNRLIVHVDNVRPDKVAQFEAARVRFVQDLRVRGVDDRRGHYFKIGETRFYSVVPFRTFTELDALGAARSAAQEKMTGVIEEYDRLADEGLVFPHHNELWTERADLSWVPTGRPLADAVELVVEEVDPTCDYAEAWKVSAAKLAEAKYPFERRAFSSSYGSGKVLVFWLGSASSTPRAPLPPSPCVLRSEPSPARFMDAMSLP
jgi:hypothetical protein